MFSPVARSSEERAQRGVVASEENATTLTKSSLVSEPSTALAADFMSAMRPAEPIEPDTSRMSTTSLGPVVAPVYLRMHA